MSNMNNNTPIDRRSGNSAFVVGNKCYNNVSEKKKMNLLKKRILDHKASQMFWHDDQIRLEEAKLPIKIKKAQMAAAGKKERFHRSKACELQRKYDALYVKV